MLKSYFNTTRLGVIETRIYLEKKDQLNIGLVSICLSVLKNLQLWSSNDINYMHYIANTL